MRTTSYAFTRWIAAASLVLTLAACSPRTETMQAVTLPAPSPASGVQTASHAVAVAPSPAGAPASTSQPAAPAGQTVSGPASASSQTGTAAGKPAAPAASSRPAAGEAGDSPAGAVPAATATGASTVATPPGTGSAGGAGKPEPQRETPPRQDRQSAYIAHRGFSGIAPENTLPAFKEAMDQGADGFELDMQVTADGQVVVLHDYNLDRTTNGKGNLKDLPYKEVRRKDAGAWFSPKFAGTYVPLLDEALATIQPYPDRTVYCEIKGYRQPSDVLLMMDRIKESHVQSHTVVSSFRYGDFTYVRERLGRSVKLGFLCDNAASCKDAIGLAAKDGNAMIHASYPLLLEKPELVRQAAAANVDVAAWTVNRPDIKQQLESIGVRFFITDQPVLLRTAS
ncbi:hypothetical protein J31TS4_21970 [Paenibacillus sp. J31TS4]|uniref:glycerophosphodiester phosphodiesterase n=1 Tax=Paenibacillus sp. J31TS4 TaxID=2807195 RepID=UPI001B221FF6|nr:glycerophosphodiester phosphodiesterase family protein [Paenibacillus sp. J31TS4]GIP38917.1 hypothetical protein J31TS4_21970 [Paenibacillus sp. J31TS4]